MLKDKEDILIRNPGFIEEFRELVSDPEANYYYHITDMGDKILESGLYMAIPKLVSTMIPVHEEMIEDPIGTLLAERIDTLRGTTNMVILDLPDGDASIVRDRSSDLYNDQGELLQYKVPSQYIVGYIDLEDFEIIYNDNYSYDNGYGF